MKRFIAFVLIFGILCALLPYYTPEVEAASLNYEDDTWNIDNRYRELRPNLTKGGYWNSTDATNYKKVITNASDSKSYFATPRFSKSQLPIGSIIVVEEGWQYCPEGWVKDVQQSSRPAQTTKKFVEVTSAWWGSYTLRAFNIRRVDGTSLSDLNASDIHEAFHIYLPDEYIAQGYERFLPKLERCAYWNSVNNKIYTVNSSTTAVNYYTTQRMNKTHLPVGSVIVFEKGWQVQPEAWLANEPQAAQQPFLTTNVIEVTEEWWGDYTLRAFNIAKTTPSDMTNYTTEDMHCIFRVYVPKKTISIEGLSDELTNAETMIHQLPSKTPLEEGGMEKMMSYIIQTREGKIIVIDGGCPTEDLDGNYLFAYLQNITGESKPHIDAWFLTHPHLDHFGGFLSVAARHSKEITVDAVYHRFPTIAEAEKYLYKIDMAGFQKYVDKVVSHTAKLKTADGKTTPLISVNSRHSGKCNSAFDFDEVHIDILLTVEDVYWGADNISGKYTGNLEVNGKVYNMTVAEMLAYNLNETSLVFRLTFNGKTVLFLGDGTTATEIMLKYYHNLNAKDSSKYYNLTSDIVEVSHHGVQAMGSEIYDLINPDSALWCIPYQMYASRPDDYLTTYHIRQWFRRLATTNYVSYDGVDVLSYGALRYDNAVSIASDIKPYVFDAQYYANCYPELKAAYGTDETKLYNHFINYGIEEGRCASPYFDVKVYMNQNSQNFQEENKGNYEKAFKHFLSNCKKTDRMKLSELFDASVYASNHPELAGATELALLKHFVQNGASEYASKLHLTDLGHGYHVGYTVDTKAPTCTTGGASEGSRCTACGEVFVQTQSLPAMGHSYESTNPSCNEGSVIPDTAFFANFTGNTGRYQSGSAYSGVNYDTVGNWCLLTSRYLAPEINTATGTLKTGFKTTSYNHLWIQTGASYNSNFNLNYQPKSDHIAQIRVKFDGLQVKSGETAAKLQVYYFVGAGSASESVYALDPISITAEQLATDGFVTFRFPIKGIDSASHTKFTSMRVQLGNLESIDASKLGTMTFDYIYFGPADAKIATHSCTSCGDEKTLDEAAVGHCIVNVPGRVATCTESGLTAGRYCSVCGEVYEAQDIIPAKGHKLVADKGIAPTCTLSGVTDGQHCSVCGLVTKAQERIAALGHSYVYADNTRPCEVGAYIPDTAFFVNFTRESDRYQTSSVYSGVDYDKAENWSNLTIRYNAPVVDAKAGTLTTGFMTSGFNHIWIQTGSDYNAGFNLNYQPKSGHISKIRVKFENLAVKSGASSALLYLAYFIGPDRFEGSGSTEKLYYMDTAAITAEQIASDGFVTLTFPVAGLDSPSHTKITSLRLQVSNVENTTETGNIVFDYIYLGPADANIITNSCTRCGDSNTVDSAPATGHTEVIDKAVAATCTTDGKTEGSHCSVCNAVTKAQTVVPATGHSYTSKVTTAATCTEAGVKTFTCSACNHSYTEAIAATGHTVVTDKAVAATCTTDGKTEGSHCSVCNAVIKAQTVVAATGHSYTSKVTTVSTCTKDGVKTFTCSKCSHGYTEAIAATGHTVVIDEAVAATCTTDGKTEGSHCSVCNAVIEAQTVVPATGHTAVIDKAVAATCTITGKTEGSHCSVCNIVLVAQETVAALGHAYTYTNNGDGTHTGDCTRCNHSYTEAHKFVGESCFCGGKVVTVDEDIKIYHTLDLASDISITFAVPMTALAGYDSYYLECVLPEYEGNTLTGTSTARIGPVVSGKYYYFTLTGITAVRMGDLVDATLHMTRGSAQYISATDTYSVATYAYGMLNSSSDAKMLTLCADLLRYGAEAQSFKAYRTDSLVDAAMTETHRSYLSDTEALSFTATDSALGDLTNPAVTWVGKTLDLGSKIGMKFVFNVKNYSGNIANLSMKVSYMGSNGERKTVTLTGAEAYGTNGYYYSFTFYGLLASELRTVVDVAIYEGETQLSETLRYSAESYASKNTTGDLAHLCKALFAYSDSAKAYFTK